MNMASSSSLPDILYFAYWVILHAFLFADSFKIYFFIKFFWDKIRESNDLDILSCLNSLPNTCTMAKPEC